MYCFPFSVAPNITLFDVPQLVGSGMNATLLCVASGIPQPRITWQRDGMTLARVHQVTNSMFVIRNVGEADSGFYTCVAANVAGMSSKRGNLTIQG